MLIARNINAFMGTHLGWWDVDQLDDASIAAIEALSRPRSKPIPITPEIEQRKREIRADYYRRLGLKGPRLH